MKKIVAIVLTVAFIAVGLSGCGISEDVYNEVVAERDAAQTQVESLQSDLGAAQAQYDTFKSDLNTLWTSLYKKLAVREAIIDYWNNAAWLAAGEVSLWEFIDITALFVLNTGTYVDAVENPELSQLWEDFVLYAVQENEAESMGSFAALTDLVSDLIDQDIEAIEAKLSE